MLDNSFLLAAGHRMVGVYYGFILPQRNGIKTLNSQFEGQVIITPLGVFIKDAKVRANIPTLLSTTLNEPFQRRCRKYVVNTYLLFK